jgi:hypothetical protein
MWIDRRGSEIVGIVGVWQMRIQRIEEIVQRGMNNSVDACRDAAKGEDGSKTEQIRLVGSQQEIVVLLKTKQGRCIATVGEPGPRPDDLCRQVNRAPTAPWSEHGWDAMALPCILRKWFDPSRKLVTTGGVVEADGEGERGESESSASLQRLWVAVRRWAAARKGYQRVGTGWPTHQWHIEYLDIHTLPPRASNNTTPWTSC